MDGSTRDGQRTTQQLACVLLAQDRDPKRLLRQLGVRSEHASRIVDHARDHHWDVIVYSIYPGRARVLHRHEVDGRIRWCAELVDLDHIYDSAREALAAAERAYKELKAKSARVLGCGRREIALLNKIGEGARYLVEGRIRAFVMSSVPQANKSSLANPTAVPRWIFSDDDGLISLH